MRHEAVGAWAIILLLVTSSLMLYGGAPKAVDLEPFIMDDSVDLKYSFPGSNTGYQATVMVFPVSQYRNDDITVILNVADGRSSSDQAKVQGLVDHLKAELENIGSSAKVKTIDPVSLSSYLSSGNGTLVWAGGELSTGLENHLESWVKAGGLLVAIGPETVPFSFDDGTNGSLRLRFAPLEFNDGSDIIASPYSTALGLRTIAPFNAMMVQDVLDASGTILGPIYDRGMELTSMAIVPYGLGAVLALGGPIKEPFRASMEDVCAWDLARCLEAGVQWTIGNVTYRCDKVGPSGMDGTLEVGTNGHALFSMAAFNLDDAHAVFSQEVLQI